MQAVEGVVKDMCVDMNKNLLQINEDMNKVKAEVDKQLTINQKELIRYDTRCYFNVRSKADISQLNLPHGA